MSSSKPLYRERIADILNEEVLLCDGGLETSLVYVDKIELPCFASFTVLKTEAGTKRVMDFFRCDAPRTPLCAVGTPASGVVFCCAVMYARLETIHSTQVHRQTLTSAVQMSPAFPTLTRHAHRALHHLSAVQSQWRWGRGFCAVAKEHGCGIYLDTATWRASKDWGAKLG
jgi:hypothetical protein